MEFQKEKREWGKKIFGDTIAKNAPSLVEDINLQIQEVQ